MPRLRTENGFTKRETRSGHRITSGHASTPLRPPACVPHPTADPPTLTAISGRETFGATHQPRPPNPPPGAMAQQVWTTAATALTGDVLVEVDGGR